MKIKHKSNYKLLKLKIIKSKIYKTQKKQNIKIEEILNRLKKALNIIYKFHVNNKRILFVGTPITLSSNLKYLTKKTKHLFIPEAVWLNGLLTNKESCFNFVTKNQNDIGKKISEILFQMQKNSDLIVILNEPNNIEALKESNKAKIPVISLNSELNSIANEDSYSVPGNFQFTRKKIRENFFYSMLLSVFKKAYKNNNKIKTKKSKKNKLF